MFLGSYVKSPMIVFLSLLSLCDVSLAILEKNPALFFYTFILFYYLIFCYALEDESVSTPFLDIIFLNSELYLRYFLQKIKNVKKEKKNYVDL